MSEKPNPNQMWFVVPAYGKEPHLVVNIKGELVAQFENLNDAIAVVELWNRGATK